MGSKTIVEERISVEPVAAPYTPGSLYLREMPAILDVLALVESKLDLVIIDGNVWLDNDQRKGLGARLNAEIHLPIIGVAKSFFFEGDLVKPVVRHSSIKPLFVTTVDVELSSASKQIQQMGGEYRIPTLLKRADSLCRGNQA